MKHKVKNIILIVLLAVVVFILGMVTNKLLAPSNDKDTPVEYQITTLEGSCGNTKLYIENEQEKIYLNCISSIKDNNRELKDIYDDNYLEKLFKTMEYEDKEKDYIRYMDFKNISNNGLSIIKCNYVNKIYIGTKDMPYTNDMCSNPRNGEKFIRTYEIYSIVPSNDDKYIYVTIRGFQQEDTAAVIIKSNLNKDIQVGKNYEFTFKFTDKNVDDNITSIFENTELIKVEYTDKVGLVQINDSI